ncbi:MAG: CPBP family glutamic-type intramembrane protease, partial [Actinomycetota bacterium]
SSAAFGLWHVAAETARVDDGSGLFQPAVLGGVLATGLVAGPFLAWLRLRAGGLVAPVLVHAGANIAVTVGVWL